MTNRWNAVMSFLNDHIEAHAIPSHFETLLESLWSKREKPWEDAPEQTHFGRVTTVFEKEDVGIYILWIAPKRDIRVHTHAEMEEFELILSDGLQLQGHAVPFGAYVAWPKNFPHGYYNPSDEWQAVLCIDRPKFLPQDERPANASVLEFPNSFHAPKPAELRP